MSDLSVIEKSKSNVEKYISILENYKDIKPEELKDNITLRGAIERYLYLVAQATIDLSGSFISFKKLRRPSTFSESFEILSENNYIPKNLKNKMVQMSGFRDRLAHDYGDIDQSVLYDVLTSRLADIKLFLVEISKKI